MHTDENWNEDRAEERRRKRERLQIQIPSPSYFYFSFFPQNAIIASSLLRALASLSRQLTDKDGSQFARIDAKRKRAI